MDGISLNQFVAGRKSFEPVKNPMRYTLFKSFLAYYTTEDIKGVEVMSSYSDNGAYLMNTDGMWFNGVKIKPDLVFIEITTRSGKGPMTRITPGTLTYRPLPFTLPKDFYRPRYTAQNNNLDMGTDLRATIHWDPNIAADATGKATVTFFSADKPTDYTVIIEGTDMNGNVGYARKKIKIAPKITAN
jgi:hypothetical protein